MRRKTSAGVATPRPVRARACFVSPKAYADGVEAGWSYGKSGQFARGKPANPFRAVTDAAKEWELGLQDGLRDFNAEVGYLYSWTDYVWPEPKA